MHHRSILIVVLSLVLFAASQALAVDRPFVLWTQKDLDTIKERIEKDPWAKKAWEELSEGKDRNWAEEALADLLRYRLYEDKEAADRQKKLLMRDINSEQPIGGAQWVNIVRFDMLHDMLSEDEKRKIEQVFRDYIKQAIHENALFDPEQFNNERNFARYDAKYYRRENWLPNITWPRRVSANIMAAALADEQLIRKTWKAYGSWKWYFDEYLTEEGFYGEEFSKMGATPGEMLVYCIALENLGMNELGFGYRGRHGATMRGHIRSLIRLTYPQVNLYSDRPQFPMLTIGDLRRSGSSQHGAMATYAFQHALVPGFLPNGEGGNAYWRAHGAWGGTRRGKLPQWDGYSGFTPKMMSPFWFELAHSKWPEDGYGYFLAAMRKPGQDAYMPSLLFGVKPIKPGDVKAPYAQSWVASDRGLAMLRANEGRDYWESDAPAVGFRLASPYAHSVNDSLTISGYYALNRPILLNRQVTPGYAKSWTRSVQSHIGIMVDGQNPQFNYKTHTREAFYPDFKFLLAENAELYSGAKVQRALVLTDNYLVDLYRVDQDGDVKQIHWFTHALGYEDEADLEQDFSKPEKAPQAIRSFRQVRTRSIDEAAQTTLHVRQVLPEGYEAELKLPEAWYKRGVGVRMTLLDQPGDKVMVARTPLADEPDQQVPELNEAGGTSVIVERPMQRKVVKDGEPSSEEPVRDTVFATLYQPFEGQVKQPVKFSRIYQVSEVEFYQAKHGQTTDLLLIDWKDSTGRLISVTEELACRFDRWAIIRVQPGAIHAYGDVRTLLYPAEAGTKLYINERLTPAKVEKGVLIYNP